MNEGENLQQREKITTLKCSARRGKRAGFHLQSHKGVFMILFTNRKIHKESKHEQFVSGSSLTMQRLGGCFLDRGSKLADSLQSSSGSPQRLVQGKSTKTRLHRRWIKEIAASSLCVYDLQSVYVCVGGARKSQEGRSFRWKRRAASRPHRSAWWADRAGNFSADRWLDVYILMGSTDGGGRAAVIYKIYTYLDCERTSFIFSFWN